MSDYIVRFADDCVSDIMSDLLIRICFWYNARLAEVYLIMSP